jgi:hypothetical protein
MAVMHQLTQLADSLHRQRLADAAQQRPAERLLALARATRRAERAEQRARRAERAERRARRAERQARRLRTRLGAQTTPAP